MIVQYREVEKKSLDCDCLLDIERERDFEREREIEILERRKRDGRLFLEYPLYCEGFHKPTCRGVLHLVRSLSSFPLLFFLFTLDFFLFQ